MRLAAVRLGASILAGLLPLAAGAQSWHFVPTVDLGLTWSDNPSQTISAQARSDWLLRVSPAIHVDHVGSRARLVLDYRYDRSFDAHNTIADTTRNTLASTLNMEVLEQFFFIDGVANIVQLNRSAFDSSVVIGAPNAANNRVETRTATLSPYFRGRFGDTAVWQTRFNETRLRTNDRLLGGSDTSELVASVRTATPSTTLGWSVDANALRTRPTNGASLANDRLRGSLVYAADTTLHLSVYEGYETSDFTGTRQRDTTPGLGLEWSPGPRTQLAGIVERRFFGTGHLVTLDHRTASTAWRLASRRDSTLLTGAEAEGPISLQQLMSDLLTASIPDPVLRAEAARRRLADLGSAPTTIGTGLFTQRPFLIESLEASAAYIRPRDTVTLGASQRERRIFDADVATLDAFTQAADIRTRSLSLSWVHRLTRLTNFTFSLGTVRSRGLDAGSTLVSRQDLATFFFTTQLDPRTTATFGVRGVDFHSTVSTIYRENAVFATVSFRL